MFNTIDFPYIRMLYYVGKMYGYMPFRFNHLPPKAYSSKIAITYSVLYAIFLIISMPLLQYSNFECILQRDLKNTLLIVIALNYIVIGIRSILGSIQQVFNRNQFIGLINDGYELNGYLNLIRDDEPKENLRSIDDKCTNLLNTKLVLVAFQVLIVIGNIITGFVYQNRGLDTLVMVIMNTHGINILTMGTYFCAMLISLRYYGLLNIRLQSSISRIGDVVSSDKNKMKMQLFCNISDDIDQINRLYDKISAFACKINRLYSFQLLLAIITSFGFSLSGVSRY